MEKKTEMSELKTKETTLIRLFDIFKYDYTFFLGAPKESKNVEYLYIEPWIGKEPYMKRETECIVLVGTLMEQIKRHECYSFLILGDSGLGKTSGALALCQSLWENITKETDLMEKIKLPVPIYINLPYYYNPREILKEFVDKHVDSVDLTGLLQLQLVFVLDGYDELKENINLYKENGWGNFGLQVVTFSRSEALVDYQERVKYFEYARPISNPIGSVSHTEYYIQPFTTDQINDYIKNFVAFIYKIDDLKDEVTIWNMVISKTRGRDLNKSHLLNFYQSWFKNIPELYSFAKTPYILNLILLSLPNIPNISLNELNLTSQNEQIIKQICKTKVGIYDEFVNQWCDYQASRMTNSRSPPQLYRLQREILTDLFKMYAQNLAVKSIDQKSGRILKEFYEEGETLESCLAEPNGNSNLLEKMELDANLKGLFKRMTFDGSDSLLTEEQIENQAMNLKALRDSCLLQVHGNLFRFNHRSLIEYFAAKQIFETLLSEFEIYCVLPDTQQPVGLNTQIIRESTILQDLAERVNLNSNFSRLLSTIIFETKNPGSSVSTMAANAITILKLAGISLSGLDLSNIQIQGADLSRALLGNTNFRGANLENVNFQKAWLTQVQFQGANLLNADFGFSTFESPLEGNVSSIAGYTNPDGSQSWIIGTYCGNIIKVTDANNYQKFGENLESPPHSGAAFLKLFHDKIVSWGCWGKQIESIHVWSPESRELFQTIDLNRVSEVKNKPGLGKSMSCYGSQNGEWFIITYPGGSVLFKNSKNLYEFYHEENHNFDGVQTVLNQYVMVYWDSKKLLAKQLSTQQKDMKESAPVIVLDLTGIDDYVTDMVFDTKGERLVCGRKNGQIHLIAFHLAEKEAVNANCVSVNNQKLKLIITDFGNHGSTIHTMKFNFLGTLLVTGDKDFVKIFQVPSGVLINNVGIDVFRLQGQLAFSQDGKNLGVTCMFHKKIYVWHNPGIPDNRLSDQIIHTLVTQTKFSDDLDWLVVCSWNSISIKASIDIFAMPDGSKSFQVTDQVHQIAVLEFISEDMFLVIDHFGLATLVNTSGDFTSVPIIVKGNFKKKLSYATVCRSSRRVAMCVTNSKNIYLVDKVLVFDFNILQEISTGKNRITFSQYSNNSFLERFSYSSTNGEQYDYVAFNQAGNVLRIYGYSNYKKTLYEWKFDNNSLADKIIGGNNSTIPFAHQMFSEQSVRMGLLEKHANILKQNYGDDEFDEDGILQLVGLNDFFPPKMAYEKDCQLAGYSGYAACTSLINLGGNEHTKFNIKMWFPTSSLQISKLKDNRLIRTTPTMDEQNTTILIIGGGESNLVCVAIDERNLNNWKLIWSKEPSSKLVTTGCDFDLTAGIQETIDKSSLADIRKMRIQDGIAPDPVRTILTHQYISRASLFRGIPWTSTTKSVKPVVQVRSERFLICETAWIVSAVASKLKNHLLKCFGVTTLHTSLIIEGIVKRQRFVIQADLFVNRESVPYIHIVPWENFNQFIEEAKEWHAYQWTISDEEGRTLLHNIYEDKHRLLNYSKIFYNCNTWCKEKIESLGVKIPQYWFNFVVTPNVLINNPRSTQ